MTIHTYYFHRQPLFGLAIVLAILTSVSCQYSSNFPNSIEFVRQAEERLAKLMEKSSRASWIQANFVTDDTEKLAAESLSNLLSWTGKFGREASLHGEKNLDSDITRKLQLLKLTLPLVAPKDDEKREELAAISTQMESIYATGKYCPEGQDCLTLNQLSTILETSRDPEAQLHAWKGWRTISPPIRTKYQRFVELANEGARELGFDDLGVLWRSGYDMPEKEFAAEMDRLWKQVRPLYESLHCYVRAELSQFYGEELVPLDQSIPAHLTGNMWSQQWGNIYELLQTKEPSNGLDLTSILRENKVDELEMVRYGERFFTSLGFEPLPDTFWERSLFVKPADREVLCHASAWNIDGKEDIRIKMCINITGEDFSIIHHELGHNIYQRAYKSQPFLYQGGAHDGFHEGIGDTIALSITPDYLRKVGLVENVTENPSEISLLLRLALDKVAFLPFGLMLDHWRWGVFSGDIPPQRYNKAWWELIQKYQGIRPPITRNENNFDPGAKFHIPANTPYARYFLAHILQFQFHRALCQEAGWKGPLHGCSIYQSAKAGNKLKSMLTLGASQPWPDALEAITGQRKMDASAILDYFAPLQAWLNEQNQGRICGW